MPAGIPQHDHLGGINPMHPSGFGQAFVRVVSELLARNRSYFGAGGPGYYGVEVDNLSIDGAEFDLCLTFKSGVRYCCLEPGCHLPLSRSTESRAAWFREVRSRLAAAGVESPPPMTIRTLRVVAETGAIFDDPSKNQCPLERDLEYNEGPFHEDGQITGN
jgi:hypothetical protein